MPFYQYTNENLAAIIKGMAISEEDRVLAICGSGDQLYAIAEYTPHIIGVDNNEEQVTLAKQRMKALQQGDMRTFLNVDKERTEADAHIGLDGAKYNEGLIKRRDLYFTPQGRRERIIRNLNNIIFEHNDIFSINNPQAFDKIYLSNATFPQADLTNINASLKPGGLVYVSNRYESEHALLEQGLQEREDLITRARKYQNSSWRPGIYQKKSI